jgi:recombination associated protein RdgC
MWFRNLQIYRLPRPWAITAEQLEQQLARAPFVATTGTDPASRGWVAPRDGALVHAANGHWLIRLKTEKRLLPASVVNGEVRDRAKKLEELQGYAPGRKALRELRERVVEELLPKSHPVQNATFVWIDPRAGWLCVDAGTSAKAGAVIDHLRHCLDDFPLALAHTLISPQSAMADWLAGEAPDGFTIDRDCELKACGEDKASVAFKRHPLSDEWAGEIKEHLAAGKLPTKLALTWDDRISFVLTEKFEAKRLAFLDLLREEAEQNAEMADDQFDADFALMTGELSRFLPRLVEVLGGEVA